MNDSCYTIKTMYFENGIFDEIVDCTYVILCCGDFPKREKHVFEHISKLKPSKIVKLVYNYGFKKCSKQLVKQSTEYDLRDTLMYIFNDSKVYDNILVLEDDFEIDYRISKHAKYINQFVSKHCPHVYGLGNTCMINPLYLLSRHQKTIYMSASHGVIYNSVYRNKILNLYETSPHTMSGHVDRLWLRNDVRIYRYYIPLMYQKHPLTENMTNWNTFLPLDYVVKYMKILELDKDARKGYDRINILNYSQTFLLTICFFLLIHSIYKLSFIKFK